jgi:hypothetical protein
MQKMSELLLEKIRQLSDSLTHHRLQTLISYKELVRANKGLRRLAGKVAALKVKLAEANEDLEGARRALIEHGDSK